MNTTGCEYDRLMREPWELSPAYDVTFAHNPVGDWTNQHLMSVNGSFKNFTEDRGGLACSDSLRDF